jgi:hypothetical protein
MRSTGECSRSSVLLAGCSFQRAQVAQDAQASMVELPKRTDPRLYGPTPKQGCRGPDGSLVLRFRQCAIVQ